MQRGSLTCMHVGSAMTNEGASRVQGCQRGSLTCMHMRSAMTNEGASGVQGSQTEAGDVHVRVSKGPVKGQKLQAVGVRAWCFGPCICRGFLGF